MKPISNLKYKIMISSGVILASALSIYATEAILSDRKSELITKKEEIMVKEVSASQNTNGTTQAKKIKIALLLDTSNSMDGLIQQAKSQLWTIVNELAAAKCDSNKPEILIALYEYGNTGLDKSTGFIRQVTPLTNDLDKISEKLFSLTTNGGDEYCGQVIQSATRQLNWSPDGNDLQVIFIAGNEEFSQGTINYKEACAEAKKKNIIVNTIFCGDFNEGISSGWKNGADLTEGSYMSIEQNSKTVYIPTPYDDEITQLNSKLNYTYVEYGTEGKYKKETQMKQDFNANSVSKSNEVNRAVSKTTHVYNNKSWDMVDATEDKAFDISKVSKDQLPDTMKSMTNEQKVKYIQKQKQDREKIKAEIIELNNKRQIYISSQEKVNTQDSKMLDKSMINSIKKQAEKKNFKF
jgi:hypothetical protein